MDTFVFYNKGTTTKVVGKTTLSQADMRRLRNEGFEEYPLEIKAGNQKEAIAKLNGLADENLESLGSFTFSILGALIFSLLIPAIVFLFNLHKKTPPYGGVCHYSGRKRGSYKPRFSINRARSTRRFEKPHSLSYQAKILTSLPPITRVDSPSMIEERGSPR